MKRGKSKISLKNSKNVKLVFGIFVLVVISAVFVYGYEILDGKAFIVPKYSSEDVSAYSDCVKVTNNLAWDLFIPLNTSAEWNFFRNAILPLGLTKGACTSCDPTCYACGVQNECGNNCGCPSGYNCVSGECLEDISSCLNDCTITFNQDMNECSTTYSGCVTPCFNPCRIDSTSFECTQCMDPCIQTKGECESFANIDLSECEAGCSGGSGGGGGSTPPTSLPN